MLNRKTLTLAALVTAALWLGGLAGCTVTLDADWPGGWANKDQTQTTVEYREDYE